MRAAAVQAKQQNATRTNVKSVNDKNTQRLLLASTRPRANAGCKERMLKLQFSPNSNNREAKGRVNDTQRAILVSACVKLFSITAAENVFQDTRNRQFVKFATRMHRKTRRFVYSNEPHGSAVGWSREGHNLNGLEGTHVAFGAPDLVLNELVLSQDDKRREACAGVCKGG
jgi:hypothetical protein